ncbi:hypothetical protein VTK26DRAFT_8205 [Humicola hyalothermophila]
MWTGHGTGGFGGGGERLFADGLAVPVVLFAFGMVGAVVFMAGFDYGAVLHELALVAGWPPPEQTTALFLLVGPMSKSAAAVLVLAEAARGRGGDGMPAATGLAGLEPVQVVCVLLALMMGGMAICWVILGFMTTVYRMWQRQLTWNTSWHGLVPPITGLAIATVLLGKNFNSPFFGIAACVFIISGALMFLVNIGFTIRLAVRNRGMREVSTGRKGGGDEEAPPTEDQGLEEKVPNQNKLE